MANTKKEKTRSSHSARRDRWWWFTPLFHVRIVTPRTWRESKLEHIWRLPQQRNTLSSQIIHATDLIYHKIICWLDRMEYEFFCCLSLLVLGFHRAVLGALWNISSRPQAQLTPPNRLPMHFHGHLKSIRTYWAACKRVWSSASYNVIIDPFSYCIQSTATTSKSDSIVAKSSPNFVEPIINFFEMLCKHTDEFVSLQTPCAVAPIKAMHVVSHRDS